MYIAPNTTIKLYTFVPLDNSYKNTLWFDDINAQNNYFHGDTGILRKAYTENSYQRVHKNKIRINESADFLYCCSYLAFQNTNFGNKWFYAFILSVEYVNNAVCEITYEIDVMQTYLFDISLKECLVEREHASIDAIGFNIVPEPVELGGYIQHGECEPLLNDGIISGNDIVVACAEQYSNTVPPDYITPGTWKPADGELITNVYQGVKFNIFTEGVNQISNVNAFLKFATKDNKQDAIISVFMCPHYITNAIQNNGNMGSKTLTNFVGADFEGYVPKNNKLYTYPYNFLYLTSGDDKSAEYRFEWFANPNAIVFDRRAQMSCTPSAGVIPTNYKNGKQRANVLEVYGDLDNIVTKDNFPVCSYTIDSFRAWLAQNVYNLWASPLTSVMGMIGNGMVGNTFGAVSSGASGVVNPAVSVANATRLPAKNKGNTNANNILFSMGANDIYACRKGVQGGFAHLIDDFFTKYGYAMEYIKVPNRNVRKEFTYTKTRGCVAVGICPADDTKKICDIYDNGITFWKNAQNVGNYSVDNSTL